MSRFINQKQSRTGITCSIENVILTAHTFCLDGVEYLEFLAFANESFGHRHRYRRLRLPRFLHLIFRSIEETGTAPAALLCQTIENRSFSMCEKQEWERPSDARTAPIIALLRCTLNGKHMRANV